MQSLWGVLTPGQGPPQLLEILKVGLETPKGDLETPKESLETLKRGDLETLEVGGLRRRMASCSHLPVPGTGR